MALKGVRCVRGQMSLEEHQRCMIEQPGPPCGIEPTILEMITRPSYEREAEGVVFSPTVLSGCFRQSVLTRDTDFYLDVEQGYKIVRGSIVHAGLGIEPAYPGVLGVVREKRMKAPINTRYGEQTFGGKPDLVVLNRVETVAPVDGVVFEGTSFGPYETKNVLRVKIVDYKTRSEVGHDLIEADRKHVSQVNDYAWLVEQFLGPWLNARSEFAPLDFGADYADHLFLNEGVELPYIDEVVVEELSITYLDMKKPRTFTSAGFLYAQGKMMGDKVNGRWRRRNPPEWEELELEPIHHFTSEYTESRIRKGIEDKIASETTLAPPLEGDDARLMCKNCSVKDACYRLGKKQGYAMLDQEPYVLGGITDE